MTTTRPARGYTHHYIDTTPRGMAEGRHIKITDSAVIAGRRTGVNLCVGPTPSKTWGVTMSRRETRLLLYYIVRSYLRSIRRDLRRKHYRRIYTKIYGKRKATA